MKKLLLIAAAAFIGACSSDDSSILLQDTDCNCEVYSTSHYSEENGGDIYYQNTSRADMDCALEGTDTTTVDSQGSIHRTVISDCHSNG